MKLNVYRAEHEVCLGKIVNADKRNYGIVGSKEERTGKRNRMAVKLG